MEQVVSEGSAAEGDELVECAGPFGCHRLEGERVAVAHVGAQRLSSEGIDRSDDIGRRVVDQAGRGSQVVTVNQAVEGHESSEMIWQRLRDLT